MPLLETVIIEVGSAIAKSILQLWVKDVPVNVDASTSIMDIVRSKTTDKLAQRKAQRQFETIGEKVGESLLPLFEAQGKNLDEGSLTAVALAVADTFRTTNISTELLAQGDLEPAKLAKHILAANPIATQHFNETEKLLYERIISESCEYILDIASELPAFTERTFAEVLKREDQLLNATEAVLQEVRQMRAQLDPQMAAEHFELDFRRSVVRNMDVLQLFGVDVSTANRRHRLSVAYVTLLVAQRLSSNRTVGNNAAIDEEQEEVKQDSVISVEKALSSSSRLFISGPAGSGKTTLLQWIAVRSASRSFGGQLSDWNQSFPFYIRLRHCIKSGLPRPEDFPGFVAPAIVDTMPKGWVHAVLASGGGIVLIDGLDEVPASHREDVRTWLKELVETYPRVRFIITSRPRSVEDEWMDREGFINVELQPMRLSDIYTFIDHWHTAVAEELQDEEERLELLSLAEHLKDTVNRNSSILDIATSPLLCAILCALNRERRSLLPSGRIELYQASCQILLERRDKERRIELTDYPALTYRQKRILLEDFAYWMLKSGRSEVEVKNADEHFANRLVGMQGISKDITGTDVLRLLLERTGMLREAEAGYIEFTYTAFQEFLAAQAALDEGDIDVLVHNAHNEQWQDIIIFASGLATQRDANALTSGLLSRAAECKNAGDYVQGEQIYQRVLDVQRAALGENHPDVATTLSNLAILYAATNQASKAESFYLRALDIQRAALGENHPDVATTLSNLAILYAATNRSAEAIIFMEQAATIENQFLEHIFSIVSEKERMMYLRILERNLDIFLSLVFYQFSDSSEKVRAALDLVLQRKAIEIESLAMQRTVILTHHFPELAAKLQDLATLRTQIAHKLLVDLEQEDPLARQEFLRKLITQKVQLEAELAEQIPEIELTQQLRCITRHTLRRNLPYGSAFVEFVRMHTYDFTIEAGRIGTQRKKDRYLAFVVPSEDADSVQMIDLGQSSEIDTMIVSFHREMTNVEISQQSIRQSNHLPLQMYPESGHTSGFKLRALVFDPLLDALGGSKYLILACDGELCGLPFAMLPADEGEYLIDNYHFSYIPTGRDVLRFGAKSSGQTAKPLVIADPDYDLKSKSASAWSTSEKEQGRNIDDLYRSSLHFQHLPWTRDEGEQIAMMLGVRPWLGEQALETALKAFSSPRILHLATAGFFLPDYNGDPNTEAPASMIEWAGKARLSQFSNQELERPLLRSGLALAGANTWLKEGNLPSEAEDGLLTAEDISGLDLPSTNLVVLSAAGIGNDVTLIGDGVIGLQRAFLLAGAKTLVMNLLQVHDKHTVELLEDFYRRVLDGKTYIQALREAQLAMKSRYPAPSNWGTFICLGDISHISIQYGLFVKAINPYVVGGPVRGNLFVGRRDILSKIQDNLAPAAGKNILVLRGQRRTGKTSVLFRLRDTLNRESRDAYTPIVVDMQGLMGSGDESEFFFRLARTIRSGLSMHDVNISKPRQSDFEKAPASFFEFDFLEQVSEALGQRRIFLMLDEFDKIKELIDDKHISKSVLDFFRHLMQHTSMLFLIAGTQKLREFTGGYWSVFFNLTIPIDIDILTEEDTRWLINEPIKSLYSIDHLAVNEIVRVAGCHPYFTQLVCKELLEVRNESKLNAMTMVHVSDAVNRALQSGDENIGYPWTDADCSADERLVLAVLASTGSQVEPITQDQIQQRLEDVGLSLRIGVAIKRLCDRGVIRQHNDSSLTFVVPLFQMWIIQKRYDTPQAAVQYNEEHQASKILGGLPNA